MNFPDEAQEEIKPWKKELILSLFKRQKNLRVVLVILLFLSIALIVGIVFVGIALYNDNNATLNWPSIPCSVVNVKLHWDAKESMNGFWDPGNPSWREDLLRDEMSDRQIYTYHYEIIYKYTYRGKTYNSNRYSIPRQYQMISRDQRKDEYFYGLDCDYEKIKQTHCFVNPQNPDQSVLIRLSLSKSDYSLYLFWHCVAFALYLVIPAIVTKKYRDDKKQLRELITGQKENILEDMDRSMDIEKYKRYR